MANLVYRDYNSFYGKMWVIIALMVAIPALLAFYLFHDKAINLPDTVIIFIVLILSCILAGLALMRSSIEKLAVLADETANLASGEKKEPITIHADREMNDIAENFNSIYMKLNDANREVREQSVKLMLYAKDLSIHHKKLQAAYRDTIYRLVIAAEYKDEDTRDHIVRIGYYCGLIAEKLGLSPSEIQSIKYAAPLHDVGKIGIPDTILTKSGKLTENEFEIIKTHTIIGSNILASSDAEIIQMAQKIALSHHEKWDGTGYPYGLSGEKIDLAGRIVCLADSFDALISKRPYKEPYPPEVACDIIASERGKHFDPRIADILLNNIDEFIKIKKDADSSEGSPLSDFLWNEQDRI